MRFTDTSAASMGDAFLALPASRQASIIRTLAGELGRAPVVIEKDIWVCWVLQQLFSMPQRVPMAFKGGTALSKVFGIIHRFSEDVDITCDFRGLAGGFDPFSPVASKTARKRFVGHLKERLRAHAIEIVRPFLLRRMAEFVPDGQARVDVNDAGEEVRVYYPSAIDAGGSAYLGNSVLVELGGRNITAPNEIHRIRPDIAGRLPSLELPDAQVTVLSPARTFWEKATLIHVACHKGSFKKTAHRLARHWYDLAMLSEHPIGDRALEDRELLMSVVTHKKCSSTPPTPITMRVSPGAFVCFLTLKACESCGGISLRWSRQACSIKRRRRSTY